jgi:hypothetical protein
LYELVAEGLLTLYMEANAGPYIELMNSFNNYEKSPYMTLNKIKRQTVISQAGRKSDAFRAKDSFCQEERKHLGISERQAKDSAITQPVAGDAVDYDKPHAFKTHTFKGLNWCEFCGNFLWGFTAQGVKCEGICCIYTSILFWSKQ